jgi:hypothetical protein
MFQLINDRAAHRHGSDFNYLLNNFLHHKCVCGCRQTKIPLYNF